MKMIFHVLFSGLSGVPLHCWLIGVGVLLVWLISAIMKRMRAI
jgi:hypothetical protein